MIPTKTVGKTRAKVQDALALERELTTQPNLVPGRKSTKSTVSSSTSAVPMVSTTATSTVIAPVTTATSGGGIPTSTNDDYETSKVTKKSSCVEKDEERNMVAELDKWGGGDGLVFQFSGDASLDDSF